MQQPPHPMSDFDAGNDCGVVATLLASSSEDAAPAIRIWSSTSHATIWSTRGSGSSSVANWAMPSLAPASAAGFASSSVEPNNKFPSDMTTRASQSAPERKTGPSYQTKRLRYSPGRSRRFRETSRDNRNIGSMLVSPSYGNGL